MGEYAVIKFLVEESFSEIPLAWICPGKKECWWPKSKNLANLMARNIPPDKENWEKHPIQIIASSSSLESARRKALDSEYCTTSDEGSKGRGKRIKKPKILSSSSDEENEAHTPPPALKITPSKVTYPLNPQTKVHTPTPPQKKAACKDPLIHQTCVNTPQPSQTIPPSRGNYSLSKHTSGQLKLTKQTQHDSDHESSISDQFISSDSTQETFSDVYNEDVTLILKENVPPQEEMLSMSENIKRILSICRGTLLEIKSINERLRKIEESSDNTPKVDVSAMVSDKIPCESVQDIERLENCLKEEEFKNSFTDFVKSIGGRNAKDHIHRSLHRLFTNALGTQCSWLGYRNNFKIQELKSIRILIGVITFKHHSSESDVEIQISEWFRLSKLRLQREKSGP